MIPDDWRQNLDLSSLSMTVVGKRWSEKFGVSPDEDRMVAAEQVHGVRVVEVGGRETGTTIKASDGLLTRATRVWLRVHAADCIPLFLFDDRVRVVGLVHVGWRGLIGGVVEETVEKVGSISGLSPRSLFFILGPSIGGCCWEVGAEVVEIFRQKYGERAGLLLTTSQRFIAKHHPRMGETSAGGFIDLRLACVLTLREMGVETSRLWAPPVCTRCQDDRYHSYRGEGRKPKGENTFMIGKI